MRAHLSTHEKALTMNLDHAVHGTFAEIGAGQEVSRWFFRVGGAAGTVAKTMSAYDMAVSDAIYGPSDRYVSRQRLESMLDHEYSLLLERMDEKRGGETTFFAFADTVAATSYTRHEEGHGWMGIRFQAMPRSAPSDIIIHVRMYDGDNEHEQEALGIAGVNLIYAANYLDGDPVEIIGTLLDDLSRKRIEIDMIKFSGPLFAHIDNRLMSLQMVQQGLTDAAMFTADGEAVQSGEILYKKPVLLLRGSFRPVTNTIMDMLNCAKEQFTPGLGSEKPVVLMEMTLNNLFGESGIDHRDFLARAMTLEALGATVLITNLAHYHSVAVYLSHFTENKIGVVLGVPALEQIFDEKYYTDLQGGILEAFGRLFKARVQLLVYPYRDQVTAELTTVENMPVPDHLSHLYRHLVENRLIVPMGKFTSNQLNIFPHDVQAKIAAGDPAWETMVPESVVALIKKHRYFGYHAHKE